MTHDIRYSEEYTNLAYQIAAKIPELNYIRDFGIAFAVLLSDEEKKTNRKIVYGDCEKVPDRFRYCCPYEFQIKLYEPNIDLLSEEQIKILLWHEMMHMGIDEETAEPTYYTAPHDFEDFHCITDKFGIDWNEEGKILPDILGGDFNA